MSVPAYGPYVYVSHLDHSLPISIWDVSDQLNISNIRNIPLDDIRSNGEIQNILIRGYYLWITLSSSKFVGYSVTNPKSPELLISYDTSLQRETKRGAIGIFPQEELSLLFVSDAEEG